MYNIRRMRGIILLLACGTACVACLMMSGISAEKTSTDYRPEIDKEIPAKELEFNEPGNSEPSD